MPSPFPGMDPFVESQEWSDFHGRLNAQIADDLQLALRPTYFVRMERRVYIENPGDPETNSRNRVADVAITEATGFDVPSVGSSSGVATLEPLTCEIAIAEEHRETYLEIRDAVNRSVVTVIETLSPSNKRPSGDGRREYLKKRNEVLYSASHLVELDLLRGGDRMPIIPRPQTPNGDYRAVISRANRRPRLAVYAWPLMHQLPTIPIPLIGSEENVDLDLQRAFTTVYERAAYDLSLDYKAQLDPPLPDEIKTWLRAQPVQRTR